MCTWDYIYRWEGRIFHQVLLFRTLSILCERAPHLRIWNDHSRRDVHATCVTPASPLLVYVVSVRQRSGWILDVLHRRSWGVGWIVRPLIPQGPNSSFLKPTQWFYFFCCLFASYLVWWFPVTSTFIYWQCLDKSVLILKWGCTLDLVYFCCEYWLCFLCWCFYFGSQSFSI